MTLVRTTFTILLAYINFRRIDLTHLMMQIMTGYLNGYIENRHFKMSTVTSHYSKRYKEAISWKGVTWFKQKRSLYVRFFGMISVGCHKNTYFLKICFTLVIVGLQLLWHIDEWMLLVQMQTVKYSQIMSKNEKAVTKFELWSMNNPCDHCIQNTNIPPLFILSNFVAGWFI